MELGAQFYTLRKQAATPEGVENCFRKMHEIGYEVAQMSGICQMDPEVLKEYSIKYQLPITCTHSPYDRIVGDTDALIREHKIYGCPVIGIGAMPKENRDTLEGVRAFIESIREPIKRIEDAGLAFAYHNHAFEFNTPFGTDSFDILAEELPTMEFILDVYWLHYANRNPVEFIKKIGRDRLSNIHLKDMKTNPQGPICPCGEGVIDFASIVKLGKELGIPNALVEQDNAPDLGCEFDQMTRSFKNMKPLF